MGTAQGKSLTTKAVLLPDFQCLFESMEALEQRFPTTGPWPGTGPQRVSCWVVARALTTASNRSMARPCPRHADWRGKNVLAWPMTLALAFEIGPQ